MRQMHMDHQRLTQEVAGDLAGVAQDISRLFSREHTLIRDRKIEAPDRAAFLLAAARSGDYDFETLRPLAVGVELLAEAVRDHFERLRPRAEGVDPSLAVLGGDRIYALGMRYICSVGRPDLIRIAAATVADIAASEAEGGAEDALTPARRLAREERIFRAALDMAAAAAALDAKTRSALQDASFACARRAAGVC